MNDPAKEEGPDAGSEDEVDSPAVKDNTQFDAGMNLAEGDDMTMVTTRIDEDVDGAGTDKFMGKKERRHSSVFKVHQNYF